MELVVAAFVVVAADDENDESANSPFRGISL